MNYVLDFLLNAIALGMTFLYGSTGEIITEKVGHLNLGIPGIMCAGASGGCAVVQLLVLTGNVPGVVIVIAGILASFLSAGLMGLIFSVLTVSFKANQNVTGLTMTIFGVGVMRFAMAGLSQQKHAYLKALDHFRFPFSVLTPGTSWQYMGVMVFLAIAIAVAATIVLNRTKVGLHLRAVGENPATADAVGINVTAYKYGATIIGSGIAGLGGLFYIMDFAGSPEAYKSIELLGWLSIALVIFALWKPYLSIFGSVLFGALFLAGSYIPSIPAFQQLGLPMSFTQILKMLPYLVTAIVLTVSSIQYKRENQPPAALGTNYYREER
ncbi:MAG: ABC transporter permease [Clostridia bacterium]|nr:ABC transporter permease [Clostridia bacterium]